VTGRQERDWYCRAACFLRQAQDQAQHDATVNISTLSNRFDIPGVFILYNPNTESIAGRILKWIWLFYSLAKDQ
jgi:hypothetical protein